MILNKYITISQTSLGRIEFSPNYIFLPNNIPIGRHFSTPASRDLTQTLERMLNKGNTIQPGTLVLTNPNQKCTRQLFVDIFNSCGEFRGITKELFGNLLFKKYGVSQEEVDYLTSNDSYYIEKLDWGKNIVYAPRNIPLKCFALKEE